jgi:hypothetical protein
MEDRVELEVMEEMEVTEVMQAMQDQVEMEVSYKNACLMNNFCQKFV